MEASLKAKRSALSLLLLLCVFTAAGVLSAAEQDLKTTPTLEKGIGQYKHENYDEALLTLKKAREEDPASTLAAYYLGLTYKQLQDYKNAVAPLRDAVTYQPKIAGALIELIDCLFQLGDTAEALKRIEEAEHEGVRPAQVAFLKGLVLAREGKDTAAIEALHAAETLDATMVQAAEYQVAMIYLKSRRIGDAKNAFQQLVRVDPNSNMANFANDYMTAISTQAGAARPLKFSVGTSWQYDDNVVLMPSDSSIVTGISNKKDSREVCTASAEYDHRFNDMWDVKGQYYLYYAKQNDLGFYDVMSNTFGLQPSVTLDNGLLTFPCAYNHTLVNDKAYLSSPTASTVLNYMMNDRNMAQTYIKYQNLDYLWSVTAPEDDRDGFDFGGGVGWYYFYSDNKGFINVKYGIDKQETDGSNWDYLGHRTTATLLLPVMDRLNLTFTGDIFFQGFLNTHATYNVVRRDQVYTLSALAAVKVYKETELQFQYTYTNDDSNINIYKYSRNIFSAGIEMKF